MVYALRCIFVKFVIVVVDGLISQSRHWSGHRIDGLLGNIVYVYDNIIK